MAISGRTGISISLDSICKSTNTSDVISTLFNEECKLSLGEYVGGYILDVNFSWNYSLSPYNYHKDSMLILNSSVGAVFQVRKSDEINFRRCFATCGPPSILALSRKHEVLQLMYMKVASSRKLAKPHRPLLHLHTILLSTIVWTLFIGPRSVR